MDGFAQILERKKQGSLKVYLGYAAGVGKTFALLQEAHRLRAEGFDVVIGYVEAHARPATLELVAGLEQVPTRHCPRGQAVFQELDVAAVIQRKPQIVLVDELAHTNTPLEEGAATALKGGTCHDKRYQDVLAVLAQGINVISTLNVQHLESVAARVEQATGVSIRERLPDAVLRRADQVINVDVSKEELRERLRQGRIYPTAQAEKGLRSFFSYENLSFLREVCLREVSGDQGRRIDAQKLLSRGVAGDAVEAVMVALSSIPTDAELLIRRGVRMASQLGSPCYVVYVRRPSESPLRIDAGVQRVLQHNLQLASRLGAEVVQLEGTDVAETLVNFVSERNVRHAFFGKSRLSPLRERLRGSFLLDFLHEAVGVDVHIANTVPKNLD
ncbi:MAG: kinase [Desulfovibrionaceae bacterium]